MNLALIVSLFTLIYSIFSTHHVAQIHVNSVRPTSTPASISCVIGNSTFVLPKESCRLVSTDVDRLKKIDIVKVKGIEDSISEKIASDDAEINYFFSLGMNNLIDVSKIKDLTDPHTTNDVNGANAYLGVSSYWEKVKAEDVKQLNYYRSYATSIVLGSDGNGACSDHKGVDCAANRGDIGQVICNDGWNQSSVYYFNVDECMKYYVNTVISR